MTCDEREERLLLYAAGALEPPERAETLAHLVGGCPICAGRLAEAEAVVAHLPLALEPVAPAPAVRERLLARVATEAAEARPIAERKKAVVVAGRWSRPLAAAALAAAAVWVLAVLPARREQAELRREVTRQAQDLDALRESVATAAETARLLRSPQVLVALLEGSETRREAWGRILWDRTHGTVQFYSGNLRPPGPGRTYELWLITDKQEKIPAGTFDVDATGQGFLVARVPAGVGPVALAAVTDEPAGGVPQPTGSIHLVGKLSS